MFRYKIHWKLTKFGIDSIRIGTGKISSRKSREDVKCMPNHCVCIEAAV